MSQAWKAHEKKVAGILGGVRLLRGDNFGISKPDVVAPLSYFGVSSGTIVAECKYSKNQPWIGWADKLFKEQDSEHPIFRIEDSAEELLVFPLKEDNKLFPSLMLNKDIPVITKQVPLYIHDYLLQAEEYFGDDQYPKPHLPIVVLGKRHSSTRLAICRRKYILELIENDTEYRSGNK